MERGFKTWCEKYAIEVRKKLGVQPHDRIDLRELAKHLGIRVWGPADIPGLSVESIAVLLRNDGVTPSDWSAVTVVHGKATVVILNTSHSLARQASDLAHELAHRIRGHEAKKAEVNMDGLLLLSNYEKVHEEEADWLAGCLLLPRDALLHIRRRGMEDAMAAEAYGVSVRMLAYRMARTGVSRQFA